MVASFKRWKPDLEQMEKPVCMTEATNTDGRSLFVVMRNVFGFWNHIREWFKRTKRSGIREHAQHHR